MISHDSETKTIGIGRSLSFSALKVLHDLQQNNQVCDALIILDEGSSYPIHKLIMCSCSPFFKTVFTTSLNKTENTNDLFLPGVSPDIMGLVIDYAYLGKLPVNNQNVYEIIETADFLSVLGMLKIGCNFLIKMVQPTNVLGIFKFAKLQMLKEVRDFCWKYIMCNFKRISMESDEILILPMEDLRSIINADHLNIKNEEIIWEVILRWYNYDPENRRKAIVPLMKCVRLELLHLLHKQLFLDLIRSYLDKCEDGRSMTSEISNFLSIHETSSNHEITTPELNRPRIPNEILFAFGGWSGNSPINYLETYDIRADQWVKVNEIDPNGARAYHGIAVIGHEVYLIGGYDGTNYFNSCRCFNAATKTWRESAPMYDRRCYVSTAILNSMVYAIGGFDGLHRLNTVERFDSKTNQWTRISPMNMERSDAGACTLNGKIYIIGGYNGQRSLQTAEVYEAESDQWSVICPMVSHRSGVSCIAYHNHIYVVGGFNGSSRLRSGEKYNPKKDCWTNIPDMFNVRSNFAIKVIEDLIFVIGGFNGASTIQCVEFYDDRTNKWYEATDMNINRSALSACVIKDLPNVDDYVISKNREKLIKEKCQKKISGNVSGSAQRMGGGD